MKRILRGFYIRSSCLKIRSWNVGVLFTVSLVKLRQFKGYRTNA
jgi:hypothetical protein